MLLQYFSIQEILEVYMEENFKVCMRKTRRNGKGKEDLEIINNRSTRKKTHRFY